jgi:capsular polysaccharide transport system permease protein
VDFCPAICTIHQGTFLLTPYDRTRKLGELLLQLHGPIQTLQRYLKYFGALLKREHASRLDDPVGSFLELLEPIFLIAIMTASFQFLGRRNSSPLGDSPVLFYATGFFFLYYFIYVSGRMKRSVSGPMQRFPLERRLDYILVHIFLRTFDYFILGVLLFGAIFLIFTPSAFPHSFGYLAIAMLAAAMLGFGWGVLNLTLTRVWRFWGYIFPLINRGLIIFTGVIFIVDFLSPGPRYILSFVPLVHSVSLFRLGFFPNQPLLVLDLQYLVWTSLIAVAIGFALERTTLRSETFYK